MTRTYKSVDARTPEKTSEKVAAAPVAADPVIVKPQPGADHSFQPGDIVSIRSYTLGTILAVTGDGIQVDFGLGSGWYSKEVLTLVKAASNT